MTKYFLNILALSFSIGLVIILTLIISETLNKKYIIRWRYFLWLILSIRLLIPIGWNLPISDLEHKEIHKNIIFNENQKQTKLNYLDIENNNNLSSKEENLKTDSNLRKIYLGENIFKIIKTIYIIGFIIFLAYHFIIHLVFKKKIVNLVKVVKDDIVIDTYQKISDELGLKRKARIFENHKVLTPILIGIIRPTIIIPSNEYSKEEIYYILKHELQHIKRKDLEYKLMILIANGIHWFNPLIYIMRKVANMDIEICCDLDVLKNEDENEKRTYCKVLLSSIERERHSSKLATYFIGGKKEMKKRFKSIIDSRKKKNGILVLFSILVIAFLINTFVLDKVEGSNVVKGINDELNQDIDTLENNSDEDQNLVQKDGSLPDYVEEEREVSEEFAYMLEHGRKDKENISVDRGMALFVMVGRFEILYEDELDYDKFDEIKILPDKYSKDAPFYKKWGKNRITYVGYSLNNCKFTADSDIPFSADIYTKEKEKIAQIKSTEEDGNHGIRINFSDEEYYYIILANEEGKSTENASYSIWK